MRATVPTLMAPDSTSADSWEASTAEEACCPSVTVTLYLLLEAFSRAVICERGGKGARSHGRDVCLSHAAPRDSHLDDHGLEVVAAQDLGDATEGEEAICHCCHFKYSDSNGM